jgi:hypothetical protein
VEIALAVAATATRRQPVARVVFRLEALHARPSLDQRPVHCEVLVRQEHPDLGLTEHRLKELGRDVAVNRR